MNLEPGFDVKVHAWVVWCSSAGVTNCGAADQDSWSSTTEAETASDHSKQWSQDGCLGVNHIYTIVSPSDGTTVKVWGWVRDRPTGTYCVSGDADDGDVVCATGVCTSNLCG